jgi:hypothetical protein
MSQMHKKIAEIIKKQREDLEPSMKANEQSRGVCEKLLDKTTKELADYFEKEDNEKYIDTDYEGIEPFNKTQFLKECGVQQT